MNSAVEPIFNEKIDKKWSLWDSWTVHKCTVHRGPGQQLLLGRIKKQKKKENAENVKHRRATLYTNTHYMSKECNPRRHLDMDENVPVSAFLAFFFYFFYFSAFCIVHRKWTVHLGKCTVFSLMNNNWKIFFYCF